ncbi:MAG: LysM peptidoglycan-binding domain-containing protein, partial [Pseudobdellovibrio sp.]
DTLAKIALKYYAGPVYGKNGSIQKLIADNPGTIKNVNYVPPGTELKFKKESLREGMVDPDAVADDNMASTDDDSDSEQGLNPPIEVEKYDSVQNPLFKNAAGDKINFIASFIFNNFEATDLTTKNKFFFTTSNETNVGIEYVKNLSEFNNVFLTIAWNQFAVPADSTLTPNMTSVEKAQFTGILGGRYMFTDDNLLNYSINYLPHYYLGHNSYGLMELSHYASASYSVSTENHFYKNRDYVIGFDLGIEYISNPKNTGKGLDATFAYNFGLVYQQDFKSGDNIKAIFNANQTNLDTDLYKLEDTALSLNFVYSLPY